MYVYIKFVKNNFTNNPCRQEEGCGMKALLQINLSK